MDSFFTQDSAEDDIYRIIRDEPRYSEERKFIEEMWLQYKPYADTHFLQEARKNFKQRIWEMYLAYSLINEGFSIESGNEGPDIYLQYKGLNIWIEAIVPTVGTGNDAVIIPEPARMQNGKLQGVRVDDVPDKEAILRYRSAIEDKYKKYKKYLDNKILKPNDCYIIAVNGSAISSPPRELEIPRIIRSVLPFGNETLRIDLESSEVIEQYYNYQDTLYKSNGALVSKNIFFNPAYSGISALLFSCVDALNRPKNFGDNFVLLHNPVANNPLFK